MECNIPGILLVAYLAAHNSEGKGCELAQNLRSSNAIERRSAALQVLNSATYNRDIISALTNAISDADEETRLFAIVSLGFAGKKAANAVPKLFDSVEGADQYR